MAARNGGGYASLGGSAPAFKKVRVRGTLNKVDSAKSANKPLAGAPVRRRRKAMPNVNAHKVAEGGEARPVVRVSGLAASRRDALAAAEQDEWRAPPLPPRGAAAVAMNHGLSSGSLLSRPARADGEALRLSPQPWKTPRRVGGTDPHAQPVSPAGLAARREPEPEPEPEPYSQRAMLSSEDIALVDELRARIADVLAADVCARLRDDTTLHRFVVARQGDLDAAEAMLRQRKVFTTKFGLDEVWADWRPARGRQMSQRAQIGSKIFYAGLSGWTKEGGPLLVDRLGQADLAGIAREGSTVEDLALEAYVIYMETILRMDIRATREEQKYIRGLMVVDLSGLSLS